jgi:integral membrane sensor domain MASE1
MKKFLNLLLFMLVTCVAMAQGDTGANDFFKSNLKIYVVVAVLTIILSCLFIFLFAIERRLKKLEERS